MRVLSACGVVCLGKTISFTWKDCGDSSTHGHVTGVTTKPDPPVLGTTTAITGTGTLDEGVSSGTYNVDVSVPVIGKVVSHSDSICGDSSFDIKVLGVNVGKVSIHGLTCPAAAGTLSLEIDALLNDNLPAGIGQATIAMTATDQSNGKLVCMNVEAKIENGDIVV
uniref:MD-2-related lipid-recognition domain-containing protein n=1 Tax=Oxyrrhis marina TaxID=2969 RepID=A0A6U9JXV2_OXYMA